MESLRTQRENYRIRCPLPNQGQHKQASHYKHCPQFCLYTIQSRNLPRCTSYLLPLSTEFLHKLGHSALHRHLVPQHCTSYLQRRLASSRKFRKNQIGMALLSSITRNETIFAYHPQYRLLFKPRDKSKMLDLHGRVSLVPQDTLSTYYMHLGHCSCKKQNRDHCELIFWVLAMY